MKNSFFHIDSILKSLPAILRLLTGITLCSFALSAQTPDNTTASNLQLDGGITIRFNGYTSSGIPDRYEPFIWLISGSPVLRAGKYKIPIRIQTGNLGINRFGQPFNKFSIHPKGEWWKLHLGHANITWSPYTLGGRTFLGGAVELNPGKFRFGFAYGQFQNAVEEFTDTLYQRPPTILFRRTGFATRLGLGTSQDHWDLIFFKARDDTASVMTKELPPFSSPQENVVIGLTARQRIATGMRFDMDLALSAYSNNLRSEPNELEENSWSKALKSIFTPRLSGRYNFAGEAALKYQKRSFGFDLRYKRVDTDFKSMGAYFLQHDVENILFGLNFQAIQTRLRFNGSYGWQRNNVSQLRSSDTSRKIGRLSVQYSLTPRVHLHLNFHNFITELQRRREILDDTLALNQGTQHLNAGGRWSSQPGILLHSIFFEVFFRSLKDRNTEGLDLYRSKGVNASYRMQFTKSQSNVEAGLYLDSYDFKELNYLRVQPHVAFNPVVLKKKLFLGARMTASMIYSDSELQYTLYMPGVTASLRPSRKHQLNFYLNYLGQRVKTSIAGPDFFELRSELSYTFHFH